MSRRSRVLFFLSFTLAVAAAVYSFLPPALPLSPLGDSVLSSQDPPPESSYLIFGFVPYWNLKKVDPLALSSITHFAYFNLHLNSDGTLYTHVNRREQDPGYTNYRRLLSSPPAKPLTLTFMPESQAALASLLSSSASRTRAINTILETVSESGAQGVNVDFEPLGDSPVELRRNFTLFIQSLASRFNGLLSVSIYPSAVSRPRLWDLSALAPHTDYFVVMTYDYTLPGSVKTGPNSPLRGAGSLFEHDILKNLAEITALVPSRQVLLGIPFYGYEWDTDSADKYTSVSERGAVASLARINQLIEAHTLELLWDRNSLTPYAIRREEGGIVSQIYYEDVNSIKLKLELVKQAQLGGIAIWALGYEGQNSPLWSTITHELKSR